MNFPLVTFRSGAGLIDLKQQVTCHTVQCAENTDNYLKIEILETKYAVVL